VEHAGDLDSLTELLGLEEFEVVDFSRDRELQLGNRSLPPILVLCTAVLVR
jgi:hypothetical protein